MKTPPAPLDSLPKYLSEGLLKQRSETLREVQQWIDKLLEYRAQSLDEEEILDNDEQANEIEETSKGTVVVRMVPCGEENCSSLQGVWRNEHPPIVSMATLQAATVSRGAHITDAQAVRQLCDAYCFGLLE